MASVYSGEKPIVVVAGVGNGSGTGAATASFSSSFCVQVLDMLTCHDTVVFSLKRDTVSRLLLETRNISTIRPKASMLQAERLHRFPSQCMTQNPLRLRLQISSHTGPSRKSKSPCTTPRARSGSPSSRSQTRTSRRPSTLTSVPRLRSRASRFLHSSR